MLILSHTFVIILKVSNCTWSERSHVSLDSSYIIKTLPKWMNKTCNKLLITSCDEREIKMIHRNKNIVCFGRQSHQLHFEFTPQERLWCHSFSACLDLHKHTRPRSFQEFTRLLQHFSSTCNCLDALEFANFNNGGLNTLIWTKCVIVKAKTLFA